MTSRLRITFMQEDPTDLPPAPLRDGEVDGWLERQARFLQQGDTQAGRLLDSAGVSCEALSRAFKRITVGRVT